MAVAVGVAVTVALGVAVAVEVAVAVAVEIAVAVAVGVTVAVAVGVGLGDTVTVTVAVAVAVGVGVAGVGVAVGVPLKWHSKTPTLSTRQPSLEPLVSLAIRHRSTVGLSGRFTVAVVKPPELPLHARSPAIGLPRSVLIVRLYPPFTKLVAGM